MSYYTITQLVSWASTMDKVGNNLMLIFQKIAIWSSLVGPQGSWALVHRTTCTTCMAATDFPVITFSLRRLNVRNSVSAGCVNNQLVMN